MRWPQELPGVGRKAEEQMWDILILSYSWLLCPHSLSSSVSGDSSVLGPLLAVGGIWLSPI